MNTLSGFKFGNRADPATAASKLLGGLRASGLTVGGVSVWGRKRNSSMQQWVIGRLRLVQDLLTSHM